MNAEFFLRKDKKKEKKMRERDKREREERERGSNKEQLKREAKCNFSSYW